MADKLAAENKELQAKIDALKLKLGIPIVTEGDEKKRVEALFKEFDLDNNGHIDKHEFELLAFRCGADMPALVPSALEKSFRELDTDGDSKISFSEFYNWLKTDKGSGSVPAAQMAMLRLKLQSKAWMKNFQDYKKGQEKKKEEGTKTENKGQTSSSGSSDRKDYDKGSSENKGEVKKDDHPRGFNFQLSVGEVKESKAGIFSTSGENLNLARETRELLNVPEECPLLFYIDFGLRDGYSEEELGELVGIIDGILGGIPWAEFPVQVYHSHTLDVVDDPKKSGSRLLRLSFFSPLDPERMAQQMIQPNLQEQGAQQSAANRLIAVFKGMSKIEIPFSLDDLLDDNFRFTTDKLAVNLQASLSADKGLEAEALALMKKLPENLRKQMEQNLAWAKFLKGIDFTFKFADFADLIKNVPPFNPDDNPFNLPPASIQNVKEGLSQIKEIPIAQTIHQATQQGAIAVSQIPPPFNQIYQLVRNNLLGLRRIHFQLHSGCSTTEIRGLDFIKLLPVPAGMAAGGMAMMGGYGAPPPESYPGEDAYRD